MSASRRDFLKFVVAGSVAAGCPIDLSLLAAPDEPKPQIEGDHYDVCHAVRDGHTFPRPPVSKKHDIVIVGGGASGLSAAYFLRDHDFLLLEKEPHWGGNAYREEYEGQGYATGSAFDIKGSASEQLAREIGLTLLPIQSPDPTIVNGKWVGDTWRTGLDELPYSAAARESFKKFRAEVGALEIEKNPHEFDNEPLAKYLKGFPPEIKQWWDGYGLSNWGAKSEDTSAYVAVADLKDMAGDEEDTRVTLPGGNGALTRRLTETLQSRYSERMVSDATIVAVETQKTEVHVTYIHDGQLKTVAAKYVIMATPKFITVRLVSGLADAQRDAMSTLRYCPYSVINMIFDKPVYNRAYDTWCPGNTFTDFIVADWVMQKQPGYQQKNNILTFYTPISELQRSRLLELEDCRRIAWDALRDLRKLLPDFKSDPIEIHFYRRGHPMFVSSPGTFTRLIPAASQPLPQIFFANTDSIGPVSDISAAVEASQHAADWVTKKMAGAL